MLSGKISSKNPSGHQTINQASIPQNKIVKAKQPILPTEENGTEIQHNIDTFKNWGRSVENTPAYTFFPKTKVGIANIVTWAKSLGKRVRVSGYRHTWTHVFSDDKEILISLLSNKEVENLPAIHQPLDPSNQLQQIQLVGNVFKENNKYKHLCKIGSATTNEQFRQWVINSFKKRGTPHTWTLPLNVIMVENTFGGTNALICHGAGLNNKTISDLVTEIEFINPKGELQTVGYKINDPVDLQTEGRELIKSAAGCFGMLGVVTSITIKLDQLTHAKMKPTKPRLALAVPPPKQFNFPKFIPQEIMQDVTEAQLQEATNNFISGCENNYYSEWFWFSLHPRCWVNSWKNDGDENKSTDYPCALDSKIQEIEEYLIELTNKSVMQLLPSKWQASLLSDAAMLSLPAEEEIITPLIDGIHFRRGIQNMRVQDMEFEIPIPLLENGKPDWSVCQRAWWDAIVTVYEWMDKTDSVPMRLPLEMRIMGGSDITMAAQHGNKWGTCSIEILTMETGLVDKEEWLAFMQAVTDKWSSYTDYQGKPLNIRPHWAKQWEGLTIARPGEPRKKIINYLKEDAYKDALPIFRQHLDKIAQKGGYHFQDLRMFSNPLLDNIVYNIPLLKMPLLEKKPLQLQSQLEEKSNNELTKKIPKKNIIATNYNEKNDIDQIYHLVKKAEKSHLAKRQFIKKKLSLSENKEEKEPADTQTINTISPRKAISSWFESRQNEEECKLESLENMLKLCKDPRQQFFKPYNKQNIDKKNNEKIVETVSPKKGWKCCF